MSHRRIRAAACAAFVATLAAGVPATAGGALSGPESSFLSVINHTRASYGLPRLKVDPKLQRAARAHSRDMLRRGYFAHGDFSARMARSGARGPAFAENIAWGSGPFGTATSVVREWLASPGHRANLLRPGFRRVGVAAPVGPFRGFLRAVVVTADFAGR